MNQPVIGVPSMTFVALAIGELRSRRHVGGGRDVVLVTRDEHVVLGRDQVGLDHVGAHPDREVIAGQGVLRPVARGTTVTEDERPRGVVLLCRARAGAADVLVRRRRPWPRAATPAGAASLSLRVVGGWQFAWGGPFTVGRILVCGREHATRARQRRQGRRATPPLTQDAPFATRSNTGLRPTCSRLSGKRNMNNRCCWAWPRGSSDRSPLEAAGSVPS